MEMKECLRCGHEWYPRSPAEPKLCPSCKSKYWNEVRDEKKEVDPEKVKGVASL